MPPTLFRSREFTVTNLATVLLYAAIGVSFFLVAYELQVGAGWSALAAGIALLPATVLMLVGSRPSQVRSPSGSVRACSSPSARSSSRPGLLLLPASGRTRRGWRDVLPGAILFGLGLVTFVAPLTATVMGSVSPDHVSVASGVNNAIARTASLAALAVIPVVVGAVVGGWRRRGHRRRPHRARRSRPCSWSLRHRSASSASGRTSALGGRRARHYCSVDGPPLQPDPARCPIAAGR